MAEVIGRDIPPGTIERLPPPEPGETRCILRILFAGPASTRAIISEASRRFELDINIISGRIDEIGGEPFGLMAVAAYGRPDRIDAATALDARPRPGRDGAGMTFLTPTMQGLLLDALIETAQMVGLSAVVAVLAGLPLALLLHTTGPGQIAESRPANLLLGGVINAVRSVPFIILMVAIVRSPAWSPAPSIGTLAATVPLAIAATVFIARLFETALREVDPGLVEAAQAMAPRGCRSCSACCCGRLRRAWWRP